MTQAMFVRLDDADLASMAKRLNSTLTDDGAHAWYKHDVAELLQEIVVMRQERAHAIASFREHDALLGVSDSLPAIAAAWRESVTGLWEKAQVRKLKDELARTKRNAESLTADLRIVEHEVEDLQKDRAALQAKLDMTIQTYEQQLAERLLDAHTTHTTERDDLQQQLDSTIQAYDAKLVEMRDQRTAHVERIEELESKVSLLMDQQANEQQRVTQRVKAVEDAYAARAARANQLLSEVETVLGA